MTGSCYFFDSLGQFISFKLTLHQQVLGFSAVTKAASSDDDICKWNLACCELLGWKAAARHLNPVLIRTVRMFWEWICSKFPICLHFKGTVLLQQPESHHEACLVTLYRVHISSCMAYRVWHLNLFIYSHFYIFNCSSFFTLYVHLILTSLVCFYRYRNEENLFSFPSPRMNLKNTSSHLF